MAGSRYGDGAQISGSLAVSGSATFNEESQDVDFRIESDGQTHMLFVDSGNNRIGIGTDAPDYTLDVAGDIGVDQKIYHNGDANTYLNFLDDRFKINVGGINYIDCDDSTSSPHNLTINDGGNNVDFIIKGNGSNAGDPLFKTDASTGRVGINGVGSPSYELDVAGNIGLAEYIYHKGDDDTYIRFQDNDVRVSTAGTERVTVDPNGNVGIATTSPKVPLDIYEMGGLVLGQTMLNNSNASSAASYQLTTSMAVPTSRWYVTFKAPASGKVAINFQGYLHSDTASSFDFVYMGLSTSDTYSSLGTKYEKKVCVPSTDAADASHSIVTQKWYLTGLTPGTSYTYYIGTAGRTTGHYWKYGGTDSQEYPDLFISATSLPNTVVTD